MAILSRSFLYMKDTVITEDSQDILNKLTLPESEVIGGVLLWLEKEHNFY